MSRRRGRRLWRVRGWPFSIAVFIVIGGARVAHSQQQDAGSPAEPAPAEPAVVEDDVAPQRLYALIDDEARRQHRLRIAGAGVTFGMSALVGVGGIAALLYQPSNPTDAMAWTTLGVGFEVIAAFGVGLSLIPLLVPTSIEKLAREYEPVVRDRTRTERLVWGEARLRDLAMREHRLRVTTGILVLVLAPLTVGAGIAVAAAEPAGTNDLIRASWIALFSSLGVVDVALGVVRLIDLDPVERLWRTWRIGTNQPLALRPWAAPLRAGGIMGVALAF